MYNNNNYKLKCEMPPKNGKIKCVTFVGSV